MKRGKQMNGKAFFWGTVGALILGHNWDQIQRWLDQPIPVSPVTPLPTFSASLQALPPPRSEEPRPQPPPSLTMEDWVAAARASLNQPTVTQRYIPPPDMALFQLLPHPGVYLLLGHRGSGKTALAFRIQELGRDGVAPYAVGLPPQASRLLPNWYGLIDDLSQIPRDARIYIPESYLLFHARASQSAQGKAISQLVNLSRQRGHTLIFDCQVGSYLDRNIVSAADVVLVKEPSPLSQGFERGQLEGIVDGAREAFAAIAPSRRKSHVWIYAPGAGVPGKLMEHQLPRVLAMAL